MKKLKRIVASEEKFNTNIQFKPQDVFDFLLQIEELKNCKIELSQTTNGAVEFLIGSSVYHITDNNKGETGM